MKLKLSEMSNVAEIIGAFAIVLSLVYVGVQVKDSAAATRSAAVNDASEAVQSWYLEMGSNRQASDLWFNSMTSPAPLPTNDEFQFMMMMHAVMLGFQHSYLLVEEGTLDADYRDSITFALVAVKDLPGMDLVALIVAAALITDLVFLPAILRALPGKLITRSLVRNDRSRNQDMSDLPK
jgi:hypothetical protein